jgi:hypothetical protein
VTDRSRSPPCGLEYDEYNDIPDHDERDEDFYDGEDV